MRIGGSIEQEETGRTEDTGMKIINKIIIIIHIMIIIINNKMNNTNKILQTKIKQNEKH